MLSWCLDHAYIIHPTTYNSTIAVIKKKRRIWLQETEGCTILVRLYNVCMHTSVWEGEGWGSKKVGSSFCSWICLSTVLPSHNIGCCLVFVPHLPFSLTLLNSSPSLSLSLFLHSSLSQSHLFLSFTLPLLLLSLLLPCYVSLWVWKYRTWKKPLWVFFF